MKINLKIILQIFSILLGLCYCLFIIWNRLFRTRKIRDLIHEVDTYIIIIYTILAIITLIVILYNIKLAFQLKTNSKLLAYIEKKPLIVNSLAFIEKYIINAPKNLYEFLFEYIYIRPFMQYICYYMTEKGFYGKIKYMKFVIYFISMIKLIGAFIFIYDILYVGKFLHFFKILPLLLIPIILEVLLFMIFHYSNTNSLIISKWLTIEADEENTGYIIGLQKEYENDPVFTEEVMTHHADNWEVYVKAMMAIDRYYDLEKKIKPYFNIIIYTLYHIGWCYLLFNIYRTGFIILEMPIEPSSFISYKVQQEHFSVSANVTDSNASARRAICGVVDNPNKPWIKSNAIIMTNNGLSFPTHENNSNDYPDKEKLINIAKKIETILPENLTAHSANEVIEQALKKALPIFLEHYPINWEVLSPGDRKHCLKILNKYSPELYNKLYTELITKI